MSLHPATTADGAFADRDDPADVLGGSRHEDAGGHDALVEIHSMQVPHIKLALWTFLGSECMFFGSLIATYFFYHGKSIGGPLPREVFSIGITSVSTFVLLMSSLTMALGVDQMKSGHVRKAAAWVLATALCGAIFVGFQVYEFWHFATEKGLTLGVSLFGSSFYTMTGFHGAHVTVGVIWLTMLATMLRKGHIPAERAVVVESAGLYWHFVDLVWIIIFTFVYLLEFIS